MSKKYTLFSKDKTKAYRELLQSCLNSILKAESTAQLHAEPYERTVERKGSRNEFREQPYTTFRIFDQTFKKTSKNTPFDTSSEVKDCPLCCFWEVLKTVPTRLHWQMQNSFFEPIEPCYKKSRQTRFFRILRKMFCKSLLNAVAAPWRHGIKPGVTVSLAQHHAKRSSPPRVAAPCSSKPQRSATRNTKPPATPSYTQQRRANARVPTKL